MLLSTRSYPVRRIMTCMTCPPRDARKALKRNTVIKLIRKELASNRRKAVGWSPPIACSKRQRRRTKDHRFKTLSLPEVMVVTAPEIDGVPPLQMNMLCGSRGVAGGLYVELIAENLQYLAKASLAQHKKACEAVADPSEDSQDEASEIEESQIGESNIVGSPVVDSTVHLEQPPALESASTGAAAVDKQQPAESVLALLCRK